VQEELAKLYVLHCAGAHIELFVQGFAQNLLPLPSVTQHVFPAHVWSPLQPLYGPPLFALQT
jgi:hypothetical protein